MKKSEIVAIIPARYGSTRLPAKPLVKICGVPMVQHVYQRVKQCQLLSQIIVATDHPDIVQAVNDIGGQAIITSENLHTGSDRVADCAKKMNLSDETMIINIQGDQPRVHHQSLNQIIDYINNHENTIREMITLVTEIKAKPDSDPGAVKTVFDKNNRALYFSRSPIPYGRENWQHSFYKHLGIYAYSYQFLKIFNSLPPSKLEEIEKLEQLRVLENGYPIKIIQTEHDSPEVDYQEDIKHIESLIKSEQ